MRILCVDDDTTLLKLFESALGKRLQPNDELLTATSGESAQRIMIESHVDLLITDLVLPGISGLELLSYTRSMSPATEVIVVTGQGSIETAVTALKQGARDYLTKPLNTAVIAEKIATVRDLFDRVTEVEEYRFAKQTIEESAQRTVAGLEERMARALGLIDKIRAVILRGSTPDSALNEIRTLIALFERASL